MRPHCRWMFQKPARIIACGFGSGLAAKAPGTWGTLAAAGVWVLVMLLLQPNEGLIRHFPWIITLVLIGSFLLGVWACQQTGTDLGNPDHGSMVWDEWVAIWLVLVFVPSHVIGATAAVVIFRFFDILKPFPIRFLDHYWKSGWGVMIDDLIAALYTLIVLWGGVQLKEFVPF